MLKSAELQRRQSEIRESLSELLGKDKMSEDETRSMDAMDKEYRANETKYRAALIAEDEERQEAGKDLETRSDREYSELLSGFEVRQVVAALDHGHQLDGQTAEIVAEMRANGTYTGMPVPLEALEQRADTVSGDIVDPKQTRPIFDRLFPTSVASLLGVNSVNIPQGSVEYPVATQGASANWAATEGADLAAAAAYQTTEATLSPDYTLGARMAVTRKAMKQTGGLEQAIRRDMSAAIGKELDRAILVGSGSSGEPTGLVTGATNTGTWAADWSTIKAEIVAFMAANAISDPSQVRIAMTPAMWSDLDDAIWDSGSGITEWDRLARHVGAGNVARATQLSADTAILAVTAGGLSPAYLGMWGGVDLIRDPYTDAASGGLRLTGLMTVDLKVPRQVQLRVLEASE